ncbi:MAG TPA: hypothetical protein VME46_02575 [Acidimicrobiales bacterium]|nr:hypothetical protein [Acidimicrobiales bacterium]
MLVKVMPNGAGSVSLTVTVPKATAAQIEDLQAGLPVADIRRAGWVVDRPRAGPGGAVVVVASHSFAELAQIPALIADIAGHGPAASRPFRLRVTESKGALADGFTAAGELDLRCGLGCFGDPQLARNVGYALGLPQAQLAHMLGAHPDRALTFRFTVVLPGSVSSSDAAMQAKQGDVGDVWEPALGRSVTLEETSRYEDTTLVDVLVFGGAAAALVVLATAGLLLARRQRSRVVVSPPS